MFFAMKRMVFLWILSFVMSLGSPLFCYLSFLPLGWTPVRSTQDPRWTNVGPAPGPKRTHASSPPASGRIPLWNPFAAPLEPRWSPWRSLCDPLETPWRPAWDPIEKCQSNDYFDKARLISLRESLLAKSNEFWTDVEWLKPISILLWHLRFV